MGTLNNKLKSQQRVLARMKTFYGNNFIRISVFTAVCHLSCGYEEDNWRKLEQWFVEFHPNLWEILWERAERLTPKEHKQICDDVLRAIIPSTHNFSDCHYEPPEFNKLQAQRVLKYAPLKLEIRLVHITVVKCIYEEIDFFLTEANDTHVFELWNHRFDKNFEEVWYLKTGVHRVHYD